MDMTKAQLEKLPTCAKDASAINVTRYFTGVPCVNGHLTFRYTASFACATCLAKLVKESRQRKKDREAAAKGGL